MHSRTSSNHILKQKLISAPILSIPDWYGKPFHLYTDSSSNAIGVVIPQEQNQTEKNPTI